MKFLFLPPEIKEGLLELIGSSFSSLTLDTIKQKLTRSDLEACVRYSIYLSGLTEFKKLNLSPVKFDDIYVYHLDWETVAKEFDLESRQLMAKKAQYSMDAELTVDDTLILYEVDADEKLCHRIFRKVSSKTGLELALKSDAGAHLFGAQ